LPHELAALALQNPRVIYGILFLGPESFSKWLVPTGAGLASRRPRLDEGWNPSRNPLCLPEASPDGEDQSYKKKFFAGEAAEVFIRGKFVLPERAFAVSPGSTGFHSPTPSFSGSFVDAREMGGHIKTPGHHSRCCGTWRIPASDFWKKLKENGQAFRWRIATRSKRGARRGSSSTVPYVAGGLSRFAISVPIAIEIIQHCRDSLRSGGLRRNRTVSLPVCKVGYLRVIDCSRPAVRGTTFPSQAVDSSSHVLCPHRAKDHRPCLPQQVVFLITRPAKAASPGSRRNWRNHL
jgi:hypothetical protein